MSNGECRVLTRTYEKDKQCKFCKKERDVTNGKRYSKFY